MAGSGVWKASTVDNGNGTYTVQFQVDRAGHWIILPRFAMSIRPFLAAALSCKTYRCALDLLSSG